MDENKNMTPEGLDAMLDLVMKFLHGTVTIMKERGAETLEVETTLDPFVGLFLFENAVEETIWRLKHEECPLKLAIKAKDDARELMHDLADAMADGLIERMRKEQHK